MFILSQTIHHFHFVSDQLSYLLCLILKIKFKLSRVNYSETTIMKWLWIFIYYGHIYVTFRSVVAGRYCMGFKDVKLNEFHTMNSYLTWFYLSQTSFHTLFVSNNPSYSLCLRPIVIFKLSQTNRLGLGLRLRLGGLGLSWG